MYDWIWFHWHMGGVYEKMNMNPDKELYSRMSGNRVVKYYNSCTRRKKKARELNEYYTFVKKLKEKKVHNG